MFSSAIDHRHVTSELSDVAGEHTANAPVRWPSPGSLFASATIERRVTDPNLSAAARRSVVAPGPGALRSVLRRTDATASRAPTSNPATNGATTNRAPTEHVAIRPPVDTTTGRPRSAPTASAVPATSGHDHDTRASTRDRIAPDVAAAEPTIVRNAAASRQWVAERFLTELSLGEHSRPQPLPVPYHPIAEAITGHHRVLISTDDASRRALRAVNKVAATTDDVIHLAAPPVVGLRSTELLAHELTHVAHHSPAPRFFADDDRGPEERRADQIARVIARSPLAPTATIGHRAAGRSSAKIHSATPDQVIRRSPASRSTSARSTAGMVSAAALAAEITAGASAPPRSSPTIRRVTVSPEASPARGQSLPPVGPAQRATGDTSPNPDAFFALLESTEAGEWFRRQLQANFDRIVRLLEHHVIGELERRGGRTWKGY